MIDSLFIAISGLRSEQSHIDTISNNLANLNTTAYKKSRVNFEDLAYRVPVDSVGLYQLKDDSIRMGQGSAITSLSKSFEPGDLKTTGNQLDLAIRGNGFFEVEFENGEYGYTRDGSLQLSEDRFLQTSQGHPLSGAMQIPLDVEELRITSEGIVEAKVSGESDFYEIGQIQLSGFFNVQGLEAIGGNMYLPTKDSGRAFYAYPGENGLGGVQQGYLESSNVDLVQELVELMVAQRGYQVNSQVLQASDKILEINNSLRR